MFSLYLAITILLGISVYVLRRGRAANPVLLLFTLALGFTSLEAYYRFFYLKSDGMGQLMKNFSERYYQVDPYGLRASHLPLSQTKPNLIVLGDSHVFGAGLKKTSQRFSALLAKAYPAFHVVNLGVPGWDTKTETAKFTEYVGTNTASVPLVILTYFYNDIEEEATADDRRRDQPPLPPAKETALDRVLQSASKYSRFLEMMYYRLGYPRLVRDRLGQIQLFYHDPLVRNRHLATLEGFRDDLQKQHDAHLLIVLLPYLHSEELLRKTELYHMFEQALAQRGLAFISMQPTFARYGVKKLWVNRFDPHTNPFANRLIAQAVIDYLRQHPELLKAERP